MPALLWSLVLCKEQVVDPTEAAPSLGLEKERKVAVLWGETLTNMSLIAPFEEDSGWWERQCCRGKTDAWRWKGVDVKIWAYCKESN